MRESLMDLTGKVALISGAAGGQGAEEGRLFASLGAKVVLGDIRDEGVRAAASAAESATSVLLDVCSVDSWAEAVNRTMDVYGQIDVLVNNAGVHAKAALGALEPEALRRLIDVNLLGPIYGIRAVVGHMGDAGGGSIINIASTAALRGYSEGVAYSASKWGIRGVTRSAAKELGSLGIRVNCICPGPIDTPMLSGPARTAAIESTVLRRIGRPTEVAAMAAFLASDASGFCTGGEFVVDGGQTA